MRKQCIFAIDKIPEELLQRTGTSIVGHQPDANAGLVFRCIAYEPVFRKVFGQSQPNSVEPVSDRSPAILGNLVGIQHETH